MKPRRHIYSKHGDVRRFADGRKAQTMLVTGKARSTRSHVGQPAANTTDDSPAHRIQCWGRGAGLKNANSADSNCYCQSDDVILADCLHCFPSSLIIGRLRVPQCALATAKQTAEEGHTDSANVSVAAA